jgi:hypothetical protein
MYTLMGSPFIAFRILYGVTWPKNVCVFSRILRVESLGGIFAGCEEMALNVAFYPA